MDFIAVLERLSDFFENRRESFAVIGGVGLAGYGSSRTTLDLALVVDAGVQNEVIRFLESLGYETLYRSSGYSNHQHERADLGSVDFVYVRDETSRRIFAAVRLLEGPGRKPIPVPSPEHLIAMKVVAMKNDPSRTYQDLADIRFLLGLPGVDRTDVRTSSTNTACWSATSSSKRSEPLDLEKDLATTPEDVAQLRRIRESRRVGFAAYLRFLSRYEAPATVRSRRKTFEGCAPFEL